MSGTIAPATTTNDSLISPQFVLAVMTMAIVAGTVGAVLWHGDDGNIKLVLGFVFGLGSGVGGFYFGSSQSSQKKDLTIAAMTGGPVTGAAGATTVVTTTPPTTTTTTTPP